MKSALEIVAFSNTTEVEGTLALLQASLRALDRAGDYMAAAYVDLALRGFLTRADKRDPVGRSAGGFEDLEDFG